MSSQSVDGAKLIANEVTINPPSPNTNRRLRPNWSANAPAAISRLPKLSMKALVTHVSITGLPPRSRPIAGVATAPPENASGNTSAERHTAARISSLLLSAPCDVAVLIEKHRIGRLNGHVDE